MAATFRAGAARREITPPVGTSLGGFIARLGLSTGAAEPMHVRAMVASLGNRAVAVVTADVLGFAALHVEVVRRFAADRLGLRPHDVLLSATHTHSGPSVILVRGCPLVSEQYQEFLLHAIKAVLEEASQAQAPAGLAMGSCAYALGVNRRQQTPRGVVLGVAPEKPRPERLHLACIETSRQRIVLLSHACHPYVLGGDVLLASGDFPSIACNELEREARTMAMFLNGCAGDIAPRTAFEGVARAHTEGRRLSEAATAALDQLEPVVVDELSGHSVRIHLPHQPIPTEKDVEYIAAQMEQVVRPEERRRAEIQRKVASAMDDWRRLALRIARREQPLEPVHCELQALRVGSLTLMGIAGEPFFGVGEEIRREASDPGTWLLGYTNAYCGYIPTVGEFRLGGYEVDDAWKYVGTWRVQESSATRVIDAARAMLTTR